jgi:16S rRNA (guanine966-N2)-methyltransferase
MPVAAIADMCISVMGCFFSRSSDGETWTGAARFGAYFSKAKGRVFPLRVTGGALAGRRLRAPRGGKVRPSSDRVRESLFASLGALEGRRVADLYAGSGALGIEALSRGAERAVFVERSAAAIEALRRNLDELELGDRGRVLHSDVRTAIRQLDRRGERFELILMDPPYASGEAEKAMAALVGAGILSIDGTLVVEASRRHLPGEVAGLERLDVRRYGDTVMLRFRNCTECGGAE